MWYNAFNYENGVSMSFSERNKMMVLVVDIGNTNIVIGAYDGDDLCFISRIMTSREKTSDEYAVLIKDILALYGVSPQNIEGSIISSVVPPVSKAVAPAVKMITGKEPLIVGPGIKTGLSIKIDNPAQLGADLVADAVGAAELYQKPIIIIDMGTATTVSVVGKSGEMLGGAIIPGVRTGLEALSSKAAQLPVISIEAPDKVIGSNTIDCMRSGVVFGAASMLDGIIDRINEELGDKCTVVATGGLSEEIVRHTRRDIIHNPQLLLHGLKTLYRKNVG